ncbi:MAG: HAD-IIB family hydrolase [Acidobacteria bacterium]|nr:HAD-IIB family hydrolase [Acidobacteriota bacterium]
MNPDSCTGGSAPRLIILTDLDGTLLDHETYTWEPAREALRRVRLRRWPVVFCSSKTRRELLALQSETGIRDPFIVENGAALFFPLQYRGRLPASAVRKWGYRVMEIGWSHASILRRLKRGREKEALPIRGFSDMRVEEIAELCGLGLPEARLAARREYDEPFQMLTTDASRVRRTIRHLEEAGLTVTKGGRFYHLTGPVDKGVAVFTMLRILKRRYRHVHSLALGDGPNDLPMLQSADLAAVICRREGMIDRSLRNALPGAFRPASPGPAGWAEAVTQLLEQPDRACQWIHSAEANRHAGSASRGSSSRNARSSTR